MSAAPKKSTPGKFAYFRHFRRIGMCATKFEKTLIHFKSDVSIILLLLLLLLLIIIIIIINQVVTGRREKFYFLHQNLHIFRVLLDEGELV